MSKDEAINILKNSDLSEKTDYRNKERLLEPAKQYHENIKERLKEQVKN